MTDADDLDRLRPPALLAVRLFGLYLAVDGAVNLVGNGVDLWRAIRLAEEYAYPEGTGYAPGWTLASAVQLVAGLLLIFRNRSVMDALLRPPEDPPETAGEAGTG